MHRTVFSLTYTGAGFLLAIATATSAETIVGRWSSIARTTTYSCGDGFRADAVEVPGILKLTLSLNGKRTAEVHINLASDGSGKAETSGIAGRVIYEVAAGTGKRVIRAAQVQGVCQWIWKPN